MHFSCVSFLKNTLIDILIVKLLISSSRPPLTPALVNCSACKCSEIF